MENQYDVVVVGGGPTGFVCALGLAQRGVKVLVVEREPHIINSPRAAVYHWSVLDGLERLSILTEAEEIGFRKQDYTYLVRRSGEQIVYSLDVLEGMTRFPYNLHLGQHQLAEIARGHLEKAGNSHIRFSTSLVDLAQDGDGVTLGLEGPDGRRVVRAKWVIGADGAGSTTRKLVGLSFDGMTWPERFVATNVFYDFEAHGYSRTTLVIDDQHGAIIAKLDNEGRWRCTYMEDGSLPEATYLDRMPGAYAQLLPGNDSYRLDQSSPYRMHQRSAPTYRVGRVVLAGDAAHATNPTGGLGLTSGLFDSYILYPALAAIVREGADDAVLDRYVEVRRDIFINRASPAAVANKQFVFHANGGGAKLEEGIAGIRRLAVDADALRERLMFTKSLESPDLLQ